MAASKSLASSLGQAHARAMQNERVRSHGLELVPGKPTRIFILVYLQLFHK